MNALNSAGNNVIACRVSSINYVQQGLMGGLSGNWSYGQITGGVYYFGHSGEQKVYLGGVLISDSSAVFVGQNPGANTNITFANVSDLNVIQTGYNNGNVFRNDASMWLEGCESANIFGGPTSIAQLISNNIVRGVYGYKEGVYFSHKTIADDLNVTGGDRNVSAVLPVYMIPNGTPHSKPLPRACVPGGGECVRQ